jgi:hypothetical protein
MTMEPPPPIAEERERVVRLARRMVVGELSAIDGASEISKFVDRAGGPASLDTEHWDIYMEFYGWLSERQGMTGYEEELLAAARTLIQAHPEIDG